MNIFRRLHALADLATDAIEAIVYLFHSDTAADDLWAQAADRLADDEAQEEVSEPLQKPRLKRLFAEPSIFSAGCPSVTWIAPWYIYKLPKTGEWCVFSYESHKQYIFPTFEEARSFFAQEVAE